MTFLNPLLLLGLIAAAIPILLHLFNLRKLRTIEFSTLTFLKELQKTKIRRLKIRQLLLLILRTLLVVLLVLAFSRPTLKGSVVGSIGTHAKTSVVLIIDDSFSMTATDEQGDLLKQAKQAALALVDLLKDGDELFLLKLSEAGQNLKQERLTPSRDFSLVRRTLEEIKPTAIHRTLDEALRFGAKLLTNSVNFNKEIYIISDLQRGVVGKELTERAASEHLFAPETRFFLIALGKRQLQNLGVETVSLPNAILEPGKPFTVKAQIANYSDADIQNHGVSVFLNGVRVTERSIDVPESSTTDVEFSVTSATGGYVEGFVEMEDDDLAYDNRRYFTAYIPERIRVTMVGTAPDLQYTRLALSARQTAGSSTFEVQEVSPDRFNSMHINAADVILLANPGSLSAAQVNQLGAFVKDGGGLIVIPDAHIQPNAFNTTLAAGLSLPMIAGIDGKVAQQSNGNASFVEFDKVEMRHPIFQGMFEEEGTAQSTARRGKSTPQQRSIESPRIAVSVRYGVTPQSNSIITLSSGASFLVEQSLGSGRILLSSVAANLEWSDLPLKGLFVPLLHRSVSYLAGEQMQRPETFAGDEAMIKNTKHGATQWTIQDPQKLNAVVTPALSGSQQVVRFNQTERIGIYTAKAGNDIIQKFAVNLDPDETKTTKATDAELEALFQQLGIERSVVTFIQQPQEMQRVILESRLGVELWKHLLIAALIVALIEMFVARVAKQEVAGS